MSLARSVPALSRWRADRATAAASVERGTFSIIPRQPGTTGHDRPPTDVRAPHADAGGINDGYWPRDSPHRPIGWPKERTVLATCGREPQHEATGRQWTQRSDPPIGCCSRTGIAASLSCGTRVSVVASTRRLPIGLTAGPCGLHLRARLGRHGLARLLRRTAGRAFRHARAGPPAAATTKTGARDPEFSEHFRQALFYAPLDLSFEILLKTGLEVDHAANTPQKGHIGR